MTIDEAIKDIKDYIKPVVGGISLDMAIEALEKQQWISVEERLPEEDGLYIVTTSKGTVQFHTFNHNGNSEEYWIRCNKAWMPLPEPYQGGEEE